MLLNLKVLTLKEIDVKVCVEARVSLSAVFKWRAELGKVINTCAGLH